MTREQAKQFIPIIEAYAKGEQIQVKLGDGHWADIPYNPNFMDDVVNYRIKPKTRTIWINEYETGNLYAHLSKELADTERCAYPARVACHEVTIPPLP